jgi:hypothetical protein
MFDSSVISRTGQGRKAYLAFIGLIVGGGLSFFGSAFLHPATSTIGLVIQLGGTALALAFFFFGCRAIQCPGCHAKWVWNAMRRHSVNRWLYALLEARSCPVCGYPDGTPRSGAA